MARLGHPSDLLYHHLTCISFSVYVYCLCVLSCAILASAAGDVSASGLEQQGIAYATRAQHVSSGPGLQHTTHVGLTNNTSQLASRVHANTCVLGCLFCFARSLGVTADAVDMGWHRVLGAVAGCSISSCVICKQLLHVELLAGPSLP